MRNLKRALSLALAAIMVIGMMVIGAGAASLNDFPDKGEIKNQDAVSLLTTLGIINGKDSGNFDPTGNVTRAEMAKMISVIMNNGADNNELYAGMNTKLTDVANSWAKGHINFCFSRNIITGRGNNTFDPTANVTGAEAAKMLLVSAGYDPTIEGFTGAAWSINVSAKASALGIFKDFTANIMNPLTRDDAALLIYNALDIEMIQKYDSGYAMQFSDSRTILSAMYSVYKIEGVVIQNEWAGLDGTDSDFAAKEGKTVMNNVVVYESTTQNTTKGEGVEQKGNVMFNYPTSEDLLGKTVYMYAKKTTVLSDSTVLGVYEKDGVNNVAETTDKQDSMKDFLKGTGVSIQDKASATVPATEYYVNYGKVDSLSAAITNMNLATPNKINSDYANAYGVKMSVIDNDNDGYANYVLYKQDDLTQVSNVNKTKETMTFVSAATNSVGVSYNKGKAIDNDEIVIAEGYTPAEGDLVLANQYGGRYYIAQPEIVSGTMESYSSSKLTEQYIKVAGEKYNPSFIGATVDERADSSNVYAFDVTECASKNKDDAVQFSTSYDFILDAHGNVRAFRPTEKTTHNYALIVDSGYNPGVYASDASGKITVLLADGTKGTYALDFSNSAGNIGDQLYPSASSDDQQDWGVEELKGFLGTDYTDNSSTAPWTVTADRTFANHGSVVSYTAGQAKSYVIGYTMTEDNIMTIDHIYGSSIANPDAHGTFKDTTTSTVTSTLKAAYSTGSATVQTHAENLAIDQDTVAFYYAIVAGSAKYGVVTGYKNMANLNTTSIKVVADKLGKTQLAGMVLFNAEGKYAAKDYAYVLNSNTTNNNNVELNVILDNGTAAVLTVTKSHFNSIFKNSSDFQKAYPYTTNGSGITTLSTSSSDTANRITGTVTLLKNGTVASSNGLNYTYDSTTNIWDVTNTSVGEDAVSGSFTSRKQNAILILDGDRQKVVTAYVWAVENEDESDVEIPKELTVTLSDNEIVLLHNPNGVANMAAQRAAITSMLASKGYTEPDYGHTADAVRVIAPYGGHVVLPINNAAIQLSYNGKVLGIYADEDVARFTLSSKDAKVIQVDSYTNPTVVAGSPVALTAVGSSEVNKGYEVLADDANESYMTIELKDAFTVAAQTDTDVGIYTNKACTTAIVDGDYYAKDTTLYVKALNNKSIDSSKTNSPMFDKLVDLGNGVYSFNVTETVVATALETVGSVTVSYADGGKGSGLPGNVTVAENKTINVGAAPTQINAGWTFIGWATASDAKLYLPGEEINVGAADFTLTAIYIENVVNVASLDATKSLSTAGANVTTTLSSVGTYVGDKGVKAVVTIKDAANSGAGKLSITETCSAAGFVSGTYTPTFADTTVFANLAAGDTIVFTVTVTYSSGMTNDFTATYTHA